jgi:hypothetical protein
MTAKPVVIEKGGEPVEPAAVILAGDGIDADALEQRAEGHALRE